MVILSKWMITVLSGVFFLISNIGFGQTVQTFTTSGSWTVPAGVTSVKVEVWGGGGGGGGASNNSSGSGGGGGGAGGYATKTLTVSGGQTYNYTVGGGGAGGNTSGSNGGTGVMSSFTGTGGTVSASGGVGGTGGNGTAGSGGAGGTGTDYTIRYSGGSGASGNISSKNFGGGGGGGAGNAAAGNNGSSYNAGSGGTGSPNSVPYIGGNGGGGCSGWEGDGAVGSVPSGGGGGAGGGYGYPAHTGGVGARGQIVITYTIPPCIAPTSVSLSGYSTPICSGSNPGTFTATASGGSGGSYTYQWYKNGATVSGATNSTYIPGTLTSTTTFRCDVSILTCTTSSSTQMITVNPLPVITAQPSPLNICQGGSGIFTTTTSSSPVSYQWQYSADQVTWYNTNGAAGVTGDNTNSLSITNADIGYNGLYLSCIITLTSTGCTLRTNSALLTINPTGAASVSISASASTICAGTNVTFTATPTNGGTPTYQWKNNGSNISGATNSIYSSSSLTNGNNITCVMTSSNACVTGSPATSNTITMTVNAVPTASPSLSSNPICNGSSTTLSANATAGSGSITTYAWSSGIAGNNASGSVSASGTYSVTVTNSNSCTASATSSSLTVNAVPSGGSIATVNYCTATGSGSVTITGVSNATQYSWSLPSGLTGSSATSSITVNGNTVGAYTVTVTPQNVSGGLTCSGNPVTGTVNVVASPTAATNSSTQTICLGNAATLSGNNPAVGSGVWSVFSGPNTSSAQFTNTSVYNTTFTPTAGGSYVVRWTITNATCSSYADATLTVNTVPSQPSTISGPTPACYTSSQTYSVTNVGGISYAWSLPSGWTGSSTTNSITATVGLTSGNITVTPSNSCGSGTPRTLSVVGQVCDSGPYEIDAINGSTTTIPCGYITRFYDSGGPSGNYGNNENYTTTFTAPAGQYLAVTFSSFHTEDYYTPVVDYLSIYNGSSTGAPLIGQYYGTYLPPTIYSSLGGSLTFKFVSDNGYNWQGFSADIQCVSTTTTVSAISDCRNQMCLGSGPVTVSCIGNGTSNGGSVNDLSNSTVRGCLLDGERNTNWFYFDISASGNMRLNITPTSGPPGEMYEYDFALYKLTSAGECPLDHNTAPVRCSYADGLCQPNTEYGQYTGINSTMDNDHSTNCWNNCNSGSACSVGTNSEGNDDGNGWVNDLAVTAGEHYVLVVGDNIPHNSGWSETATIALTGTATYCCTSTPLPVELTEFSGKCVDGKVKLGWATASETNNDYFKVEKSKDGSEFYELGTVDGSGTSNSYNTYYYEDKEDGCLSGCYYRLQQFDYDGASEYSNVIRVECSINDTSFDNFSIYPNPAIDIANLDIISPNAGPVDVLVFDNKGQQVFEKRIELVKGYNQYQLSTSNISRGIYCVLVTNNYRTKSKYLMIENK